MTLLQSCTIIMYKICQKLWSSHPGHGHWSPLPPYCTSLQNFFRRLLRIGPPGWRRDGARGTEVQLDNHRFQTFWDFGTPRPTSINRKPKNKKTQRSWNDVLYASQTDSAKQQTADGMRSTRIRATLSIFKDERRATQELTDRLAHIKKERNKKNTFPRFLGLHYVPGENECKI